MHILENFSDFFERAPPAFQGWALIIIAIGIGVSIIASLLLATLLYFLNLKKGIGGQVKNLRAELDHRHECRDKQIEELTIQIAALKSELYDKDRKIDELSQQIEGYKKRIEELEKKKGK